MLGGIEASLAAGTHFDAKEVQLLYCLHRELKSFSGAVDQGAFVRAFCPPFSSELAIRLFEAFDQRGAGSIDLQEFIRGLSVCSRGSTQDALSFCLDVGDAEASYTRSALIGVIQTLATLSEKLSGCVAGGNLMGGPHLDAAGDTSDTDADQAMTHLADRALGQFGVDARNGAISRPQLLEWLAGNPMANDFAEAVRQATQTVAGIVPANIDEERRFVVNALGKHHAGEIGPVYLISQSWWNRWSQHCNAMSRGQDAAPAVPNSNAHNDTDGTAGPVHTRKQRRHDAPAIYPSPGPISNASLLDEQAETDALSISTSSGVLRLRKGLMEDRDYKLLPEKVWVTMQKWYGGGPTLRRQVVRLAPDDDVRADLYPIFLAVSTIGDGALPFASKVTLQFSEFDTIEAVLAAAMTAFGNPPVARAGEPLTQRLRLWSAQVGNQAPVLLENPSETLQVLPSQYLDGLIATICCALMQP